MEYEISVNGRLRHVTVRRLDGDGDGRFAVAMDGCAWTVDAARVDAYTMSLLTEAKKGSGGFSDRGGVHAPRESSKRESIGSDEENPPDPIFSHEVTLGADPVSGGFSVWVGETPVAVSAVSFNGRRRWRRGAAEAGSDAGSGPERLVAPMPGKIVRVLVKTGDPVAARQPLVVIEAMKMENELRAASDGRVAEVHVQEGQSVEAGALLTVIHR